MKEIIIAGVMYIALVFFLYVYYYFFISDVCVSPESIVSEEKVYFVLSDFDCELSWWRYALIKLNDLVYFIRR
uniref:hypothetical protein n=1 Tax=Enterobacter asburiae TaxID=61645 RepID=UPI0010AFA437|nr:hypothetical protein [Enterobacter asburiae]